MAGDDDRERVAGVGAADRSRARAEASRLLGVGARLAVRDLDQREPRAPLELGADEVERQLELPPSPREVLVELRPSRGNDDRRADIGLRAPLQALEPLLGRDDSQSSAPSSRSSCTFRSRPPA